MAHEDGHDEAEPQGGNVGLRLSDDQWIVNNGYSADYTANSIRQSLINSINEGTAIRRGVFITLQEWFDSEVRTNNARSWFANVSNLNITIGGSPDFRLAYNATQAVNNGDIRPFVAAGFSARATAIIASNPDSSFRNVARNGYVHNRIRNIYTFPSGPVPRDIVEQVQGNLQQFYADSESEVKTREQLDEFIRTKFVAILETLGAPGDINQDQQDAYTRWATGDSTLTTTDNFQVAIRNYLYQQFAWLYYTLRAQQFVDPSLGNDGTQLMSEVLLDMDLNGLAEIYKNARIRELVSEARIDATADNSIAQAAARAILGDQAFEDLTVVGQQLGLIEEAETDDIEETLEENIEAQVDNTRTIPPAQLAQQRRLAEQAFLLDYLDRYALINKKRGERYVTPDGDPHFIMVHGPTDTIVNKLMYNPALEELDSIKTSELSGLVPKIRLYKSSYLPTEDFIRGREIRHNIPFKSFINPQEIEDMLTSDFDRGQGVGIKSFEWRLEGRDPFAARRDIFARLTLFFQTMDEFIKTRNAPNPKFVDNQQDVPLQGGDDPFSFRYVDLVNIGMAHPEKNFIWDPDYYKIEAEVGWHDPGDRGDSSTFLSEGTRNAIKNSTMVLHLAAYDHEIDINDEGNVTLTIEYLAWQEGVYLGPDSDILSTPERRRDRLRYVKILADRQKGNCPEQYIADLQEEYKKKVRRQNTESWGRLLNGLYENDRIFFTKVDTDFLDIYLNEGRSGIVQPMLEELGLSTPLAEFDPADPSNTDAAAPASQEELESRMPESVDGANFDENETILESLKELQYTQDDENYHLQFFYFGDLLQTALEVVHSDQTPQEDSYGARNKLKENMRILLGPISYELNRRVTESEAPESIASKYIQELIYDINLADIPISVHYFIDWFLTKVVAQERTIYPVLSFIREVTSDLIANAMRTQSGAERNVARQELQLRTNFFTAAGSSRGQEEKLFQYPYLNSVPSGGGDSVFIEEDPSSVFTRVNLAGPGINLPRPILSKPQINQKSYDYMLVYAINTGATEDLDGDRDKDRERGIYHFGIGKPYGIIKNIKFSKTDIPFLRESRLEQEFLGQLTGLAVLANVYNVTIECYGTTMFHPGMKIYVNPLGLSPKFGSPVPRSGKSSPASILGIGGYHVVTKVHSRIERGLYVTTITAIWESAGASLADSGTSVAQIGEADIDCVTTRKEIKSLLTSIS